MSIKSSTVATALLRIPTRQQNTVIGVLIFLNLLINVGNFCENISKPRFLAASCLFCLYNFPISARSSVVKIGILILLGIVASLNSFGERTSTNVWFLFFRLLNSSVNCISSIMFIPLNIKQFLVYRFYLK